MLLPLVGAIGLAALTHSTTMLALAFLSPLSVLANHLYGNRHGKKSFRRAMAEYKQRKAAVERDLDNALRAEATARWHAHPDPATAG